MRDYRKFCRPITTKSPQIGDIEVKLKCGTTVYVKAKDYKIVERFFKINSILGEKTNSSGNIKVLSKDLGKELFLNSYDYINNQERFEFVEIVGERKPDPFGGHAYVDLGLPSGNLWATMNIGATSPEEPGNYYMFGKGSHQYNSLDSIYQGNVTDEQDTAVQEWGNGWKQCGTYDSNELTNNTTRETVTINGISCAKLTGQNGNYIILPDTGKYVDGVLEDKGTYGYFWGRQSGLDNINNNKGYGYHYNLTSTWNDTDLMYRKYGLPVRAIHNFAEMPTNIARDGDIIVYNEYLDQNVIFSYSDWVNLDDSWELVGLYGITTYEEEDASNGDYVILANGHTLIIKPEDYSKVSDHWEQVDVIFNPEYVDLDLTSGTQWATTNVGAVLPEQYGNYYLYGKGATTYDSSDDNYYNSSENPLSSTYDTAVQTWEDNRAYTPTYDQLVELLGETDYTWTTLNGVNGGKFASKTDSEKYIFIPAAGAYGTGGDSRNNVGTHGYIYSSSPVSDVEGSDIYSLYFSESGAQIGMVARTLGYSIRPVAD